MKKNNLEVEAIKNGTVIDHIPANMGLKIMTLFQLHKTNQRITVGLNLPSGALGVKDLIKIENIFISEDQAQRLALYAPKATLNKIEDHNVVAKIPLILPEHILGVFVCPNSNCITHDESAVESHFKIIKKHANIHLKCKYCEKVFSKEVIKEKHI